MHIFYYGNTANDKVYQGLYPLLRWDIDMMLERCGSVAYNDVAGAALSANVGAFYNDWMASNTTIYTQNTCEIDNIAAGLKVYSGNGNVKIFNDPYSSLNSMEDRSGWAEFYLGAGNDIVSNKNSSDSKIIAGDGDNAIDNSVSNRVLIVTGTGNDSVRNLNTAYDSLGRDVTIQTGAGNDTIYNGGDYVIIEAGEGNDTIYNGGDYVSIDAGDGKNTVDNGSYYKQQEIHGSNSTIQAGKDDDFINNIGNNVLIVTGNGENTITNGFYDFSLKNLTTYLADGENLLLDYILKLTKQSAEAVRGGESVTISGGKDEDFIINLGSHSSISSGAGDDRIICADGEYNIINGEDNNDKITVFHDSNSLILGGDGNDEIIVSRFGANEYLEVGKFLFKKIADRIATEFNIQEKVEDFTKSAIKRILVKSGAAAVLSKNPTVVLGVAAFSVGWEIGTFLNEIKDSVIGFFNLRQQFIDEFSMDSDIVGGKGDDVIICDGLAPRKFYYNNGDGNDVIQGFSNAMLGGYLSRILVTDIPVSTLNIESGNITSVTVKDRDVILKIGNGSITLLDAVNQKFNIREADGTFTTRTYGASTNKLFYLDKAGEIYFGNVGDEEIHGTAGNDTIFGGDGNDKIYGMDASGKIGSGKDYLDGGFGNDFILTEGSENTIIGGAGDDDINVSGKDNLIIYNWGEGNDKISGSGGGTIRILGAGYSTLRGSDKPGTAGYNDMIIEVGDVYVGEQAVLRPANDRIYVYGNADGKKFKIEGNYITPAEIIPAGISIKSSVLTAASNFKGNKINLTDYSNATKVNAAALSQAVTIVGTAAANSIKGGKGADTISGGAGNDTLTGGNGKDIFIYSDGNDIITDYKVGEDKISVNYASSSVKGSDVILTTASGNLTVKGAKDKVVTFTDGSEKIFFADTSYAPLETGLTYDTKRTVLTASNKFTGTEINLGNYLSTATKFNGANAKNALEITGNAENNSLKGGKGADTISGGSGNDTLTGGAGTDIFIYSGGNDLITDYKVGEDKISVNYASSSVKGSDVILTTANGNLTVKGAKDKVITFTDGSEKIFFADTSYAPLETGLTYDTKRTVLTASNKFTGTEINLGNYLSTATKFNGANAKNALEITGNAENNSLKGGKGADTISGGSGNDTLTGGAGTDIFIYSGGNDLITDYKAGEDKISVNYANSSVKGSDVILTTANGNLTVKGAKDKVITFTDGSEKIFFADTSYAPLETGLTYDTKRTVLTASNKFTGTEINLANYLSTATKFNGANAKNALEITGNAENNSLKGGKGADTISGGSGNDTLTGGAGTDIFIYSGGNDIITDYKAGEDKIKISGGEISGTSYSNKDVIFKIGSGTLTVKNAKGKNISVTDSSGTQTYSQTFNLFEDNNFISDEPQISEITEQKYSVTQIQETKVEELYKTVLTFAKEK